VQSVEPVAVLDLFPEERQLLLDVLTGLSDDEWSAATACPTWSVKDIALHLLSVDLGKLARCRDGFSDPSFAPPGADLTDWTTLVGALGEWNEQWIRATRRLSQRLLCELLQVTGPLVHSYFTSIDLTALGETVSWAGPDPAPVWLDVAREYTERWTHQQQIREAVGRPGLTERRFFAPVLATFIHALPHTLRSVKAPEDTRLRLRITGEAGGAWQVVRTSERWQLGHDESAGVDATLTMDQELAWRLYTKGISSIQARPNVLLDGDHRLANAALEMVAIIA
jgi:uncharacterized protein (TIGR03083 family)